MLNSVLRCVWLAIAGLRCAVQRSCSVLAGGIGIGLSRCADNSVSKKHIGGLGYEKANRYRGMSRATKLRRRAMIA
jgi:hypothetical protein